MIDKENESDNQKSGVDDSSNIIYQIENEDNTSDLKHLLFQALENITSLINKISVLIEETINDEEIRNEVKEIVSLINQEFLNISDNTKKSVNFILNKTVNSDTKVEEE